MHELAIAESIAGVASRQARGRRVYSVDVRVGHLRQVVPSALTFAFELVTRGTPLEGAELEIESVPAAGVCRACGVESEIDGFPVHCAHCGALDMEIVRGEELLVDSLELEEEPTAENETARSRPSRLLAADARNRPSRVLAGENESARTRPSRVLAAGTGGTAYGD